MQDHTARRRHVPRPQPIGERLIQRQPERTGPRSCRLHLADFEERGKPCKHIYAVRFVVERETNPDGSVTITKTLTLTEKSTIASKPTYKQDWPAYNAAQTHEKARFQELLFDLCKGINHPVQANRGRPKNLMSDMVFAVAFKVYSTFSARRFQSDLDEAHAKGYLTKSPHYNSVLNYFEDEEIRRSCVAS